VFRNVSVIHKIGKVCHRKLVYIHVQLSWILYRILLSLWLCLTDADGCCMSCLIVVHWSRLVDIVLFTDDKVSNRYYDDVLFSFCRLWSRLIKHCCSAGTGDLASCCSGSSVVVSSAASVLLNKLKCCRVPSLCRDKCFSVLLQTVDFDPATSCPTVIVPEYSQSAAKSVLREFHRDGQTASSWSLQCCLSINNYQTLIAPVDISTPSECCGVTATCGIRQQCMSLTETCAEGSVPLSGPMTVNSNSDLMVYDARLLRKLLLLLLRALHIITATNDEPCENSFIT